MVQGSRPVLTLSARSKESYYVVNVKEQSTSPSSVIASACPTLAHIWTSYHRRVGVRTRIHNALVKKNKKESGRQPVLSTGTRATWWPEVMCSGTSPIYFSPVSRRSVLMQLECKLENCVRLKLQLRRSCRKGWGASRVRAAQKHQGSVEEMQCRLTNK
jgi:hypothetical protein